MAQSKYTPANRELAGWLGEAAEFDGKISKKAYQSVPTVIFYESEARSASFDKMIEEFQEEEAKKDSGVESEGAAGDKMKDLEKRIDEAKTPEELEAIEKELSGLDEAAKADPSDAPSDKTEAPAEPAPAADDKPEDKPADSGEKPADGAKPAESPAADPGLKKEIDNLKKQLEELKKDKNIEQKVDTLQRQVDNIQPYDNVDMNDSLNQSASKIARIKREVRRLAAHPKRYISVSSAPAQQQGGKGARSWGVIDQGQSLMATTADRDRALSVWKDNFGDEKPMFWDGDKGRFVKDVKASVKKADLNSDQIEKIMCVVNADESMSFQDIARDMSVKLGAREDDIYDFLMNADSSYGIKGNVNQKRAARK